MPKIIYKNNDEEHEVDAGTRLKDVIDDKGWGVPFGCEDGLCGTCIVKVNKGSENLNPMEEKESMTLSAMGLDDGTHRLACQCEVNGDIEIETH